MRNFVFRNATKIIFGKGTENTVGSEIKAYGKKVLLHYGGGSIKTSGLYDKVVKSLEKSGIKYIELGGVKPNPRVTLVREGIRLCRENGVDFILAVGGGSVIDSAKGIAAGFYHDGDVWDLYMRKAEVSRSLPTGVILTIPAAGSESSCGSVVTNDEGRLKRDIVYEFLRPEFAVMNPELCFTLPDYQVACGASDIMAHIMERYFTNTKGVDFIDRLSEATLATVINNAPRLMADRKDYNAWGEVMWAGTVAHNDLLGTGREDDWASHQIEHEMSGMYDIAHGAGLSIIFPAWMKYVYKNDVSRFCQFSTRVWKTEMDFYNPERTALEGISRMEAFFRSLGLPVRFSDAGLDDKGFEEMAAKCTGNGARTVGNFVKLNKNDIINIYRLAR